MPAARQRLRSICAVLSLMAMMGTCPPSTFLFTDGYRSSNTIHIGHPDIHQTQIKVGVQDAGQCLPAGCGRSHRVTQLVQHLCHQRWIVFRQQDAQTYGGRAKRNPFASMANWRLSVASYSFLVTIAKRSAQL